MKKPSGPFPVVDSQPVEVILENALPLLLTPSLRTLFSLPGTPDLVAENHEGEGEFTKVGLREAWEAISETNCPLRRSKNP